MLHDRRFRKLLQETLETRAVLTTTWGIMPSSTTEPASSGTTSPLTTTIWISPPTQYGFDFYWTTSDGTATNGADYTGQASGYAHIGSGSGSVSVSVPVLYDQVPESSETVEFHITPYAWHPTSIPAPSLRSRASARSTTTGRAVDGVRAADQGPGPAQRPAVARAVPRFP